MGHPWMIGELISNLLHNAIRHTPVRGRLGIRISAREEVAELLIWDSGRGIDAPAMENVQGVFLEWIFFRWIGTDDLR
jgi:two-component system sensor histidine kinase TctE